MKITPIMVTNNDKAYNKYKEHMECVLLEEGTYLDVLEKVRDYIHLGHKLVSHPMAGSLKPNQTPYKTIVLEKDKSKASREEVLESVNMIENAIASAEKFFRGNKLPNWPEYIKKDFKTVDESFINGFADDIL